MEIVKMTELETQIMCRTYINEDRIKEGKLYSHQVKDLEKLRFILAYMKEKYPSFDFEYYVFTPSSKINAITTMEYYDKESSDYQKTYRTELHETDDGNYYCEDNFYGSLIRMEYDDWLENELCKEVGHCVHVYTSFSTCMGKAITGGESIEQILAIPNDNFRTTRVYLDADEAEAEGLKGKLESFLKNNQICGHMQIVYHPQIFEWGQTGEALFKAPCGANGAKNIVIQ